MVVHRTVLELDSQTELQRSAEQLKQLRLDLKCLSDTADLLLRVSGNGLVMRSLLIHLS